MVIGDGLTEGADPETSCLRHLDGMLRRLSATKRIRSDTDGRAMAQLKTRFRKWNHTMDMGCQMQMADVSATGLSSHHPTGDAREVGFVPMDSLLSVVPNFAATNGNSHIMRIKTLDCGLVSDPA